jgi:cyclophilin family peptidyl-prolyl cis-trans isomerase
MRRKSKKSHNLRNALIAIIVLVVIISVVVAAYQMKAGGSPPTYSGVSSSPTTTNEGSLCTFSTLWGDDANVSGYIFETNITGTFVNDTWTPFYDFVNPTSAYARVTRTLSSTRGDFASWRFWCNDTDNRWNEVPLQSLLVVSKVLLETSMGNIVIQLYGDMPITTANFINLVGTGVYNETIFHRVAYNFVIQGGDATSKGITVPTIIDELPNKHSNVRGSVAMAKTSAANSANSQFFINLNDTNAATLDSNYSVFGNVIAGMDVVDRIGKVPINPTDTSNPNDGKPVTDVTLIVAKFIS